MSFPVFAPVTSDANHYDRLSDARAEAIHPDSNYGPLDEDLEIVPGTTPAPGVPALLSSLGRSVPGCQDIDGPRGSSARPV